MNGNYIDGLVQDCSNSIAKALELLQSCTKTSIYRFVLKENACVLCDVESLFVLCNDVCNINETNVNLYSNFDNKIHKMHCCCLCSLCIVNILQTINYNSIKHAVLCQHCVDIYAEVRWQFSWSHQRHWTSEEHHTSGLNWDYETVYVPGARCPTSSVRCAAIITHPHSIQGYRAAGIDRFVVRLNHVVWCSSTVQCGWCWFTCLQLNRHRISQAWSPGPLVTLMSTSEVMIIFCVKYSFSPFSNTFLNTWQID